MLRFDGLTHPIGVDREQFLNCATAPPANAQALPHRLDTGPTFIPSNRVGRRSGSNVRSIGQLPTHDPQQVLKTLALCYGFGSCINKRGEGYTLVKQRQQLRIRWTHRPNAGTTQRFANLPGRGG